MHACALRGVGPIVACAHACVRAPIMSLGAEVGIQEARPGSSLSGDLTGGGWSGVDIRSAGGI